MNLRWRIRRAKRALICRPLGHRVVEGDAIYWTGHAPQLVVAHPSPDVCVRCGYIEPIALPTGRVARLSVFSRKLSVAELDRLRSAAS